MTWRVEFEDEFDREFEALPGAVQDAILLRIDLLRREGPRLARPFADTLKGSRHANMKELRVDAANGVWRVAYAFDPERSGIVLVAGDKAGVSQRRFYRRLIETADARFDRHLTKLKE